jgi:hypothetical protein
MKERMHIFHIKTADREIRVISRNVRTRSITVGIVRRNRFSPLCAGISIAKSLPQKYTGDYEMDLTAFPA